MKWFVLNTGAICSISGLPKDVLKRPTGCGLQNVVSAVVKWVHIKDFFGGCGVHLLLYVYRISKCFNKGFGASEYVEGHCGITYILYTSFLYVL